MLVSFCIHASQLSCMCTSSYLIGNGWNSEEWVHITWDGRADICMWKRTVNFKLGLHKKNIASTNIELLKCRSSVHIHLFLRSVLKSCRHKMFPVLLDRHVEEFNLFFEDHSNACNLFQLLITMDQKLYVHFAIHRCLKVRRLKHGRISVFGTPQRVTVSLCDYYIQGEIPLWWLGHLRSISSAINHWHSILCASFPRAHR